MLKRIVIPATFLAVVMAATPVSAQKVPPAQSIQVENVELKKTIAGLQKQLSALSSRVKKLESVISIKGNDVHIRSANNLTIEGRRAATLKGAAVTVDGTGIATIKGGVVMLGGKGGRPIARVGDRIMAPPTGGPGTIVQGSPTILAR